MSEGVKDLHNLGYVHLDLNPSNFVLNLNPLEVRLIDFKQSTLKSNSSLMNPGVGEPFQPLLGSFKSGSTTWDRYGLAALIIYSFFVRNYFFKL